MHAPSGPAPAARGRDRLQFGDGGSAERRAAGAGTGPGRRHGLAFAHQTYTEQLTELRDQLKAGLSANPPEGTPPTAETAEKIKTLKASNTVDAPASPRSERKIDAEEPVTRKILRQM